MGKTKIEWCDYTINPVKGKCPSACPYCYARRLYDRFHWNPGLRLALDAFQPLRSVAKPSRVFVGSTMELFGDWIPKPWMMDILSLCESYKRAGHIFLFLTKQPQNFIMWSPFPENCWVGVTATNMIAYQAARNILPDIKAKVRFISFEPLLGQVIMKDSAYLTPLSTYFCDWLIIGQQTPVSKKTEPKIEWVKEIVEAADKAGSPVFLKNNLMPLLITQGSQDNRFWRDLSNSQGFEPLHCELRQELPGNCPEE